MVDEPRRRPHVPATTVLQTGDLTARLASRQRLGPKYSHVPVSANLRYQVLGLRQSRDPTAMRAIIECSDQDNTNQPLLARIPSKNPCPTPNLHALDCRLKTRILPRPYTDNGSHGIHLKPIEPAQ